MKALLPHTSKKDWQKFIVHSKGKETMNNEHRCATNPLTSTRQGTGLAESWACRPDCLCQPYDQHTLVNVRFRLSGSHFLTVIRQEGGENELRQLQIKHMTQWTNSQCENKVLDVPGVFFERCLHLGSCSSRNAQRTFMARVPWSFLEMSCVPCFPNWPWINISKQKQKKMRT